MTSTAACEEGNFILQSKQPSYFMDILLICILKNVYQFKLF